TEQNDTAQNDTAATGADAGHDRFGAPKHYTERERSPRRGDAAFDRGRSRRAPTTIDTGRRRRQPEHEANDAEDIEELVGDVDVTGADHLPDPFDPAPPVVGDEPEDDRSFDDQVKGGLRWSLFNQMALRFVNVGTNIVLARILLQEDLGIHAVALAVVNILMALNDLGLHIAIVRWKGDLRQAASVAMTIVFAFSVLVYAGVALAAGPIANAVNSPEAAGVMRLMAVIILIDGLITAPRGLLLRAFRQDKLAKGELFSIPVMMVTQIGMALAGAGAWSLATGMIAGAAINASFVLRYAPFIPRFGWDRQVAREMLAFGAPLAGTALIEFSLLNADYLIVSAILGTEAVGVYLLAFNISSWPSTVLSQAIRKVSISSFAKLADDNEALQRGFARSFAMLATLTILVCMGLSVLAEPVVDVIYGIRWQEAAAPLAWLTVLGGIRVMISFVFDFLVGTGRSRTSLAAQAVWFVAVIPALIIGANSGSIEGVAIGHVVAAVAVALPVFGLALRHAGVDIPALLKRLARPVLGGAAGAATGFLLLEYLTTDWVRLFVIGPVIAVVYLIVAIPLRDLRSGAFLRLNPATAPESPEIADAEG
ncbi:MAG: lipopolysaccharide biosynthesis protein, partial [Actinomycetota bacterium]|nr:lipopolysaccharide biosynthesis protein [Actinomycetota bacterium]